MFLRVSFNFYCLHVILTHVLVLVLSFINFCTVIIWLMFYAVVCFNAIVKRGEPGLCREAALYKLAVIIIIIIR